MMIVLNNFEALSKVPTMECDGMGKALDRHQRKECCESELCDLNLGCTLRILQCRISSMQPFNDTFSVLSLVISYRPRPKSWHWRHFQRLLLVNDTFTSQCILSLRKHFLIACHACVPFHSKKISVCSAVFLAGFTVLQSDKASCFFPFFFSPNILLDNTCWSIQKTRGRQKCWDDGKSRVEVRPCRIPQTQCHPADEYWPRPGKENVEESHEDIKSDVGETYMNEVRDRSWKSRYAPNQKGVWGQIDTPGRAN